MAHGSFLPVRKTEALTRSRLACAGRDLNRTQTCSLPLVAARDW